MIAAAPISRLGEPLDGEWLPVTGGRTVAFAVTSREQRDCQHENSPPSPGSGSTITVWSCGLAAQRPGRVVPGYGGWTRRMVERGGRDDAGNRKKQRIISAPRGDAVP